MREDEDKRNPIERAWLSYPEARQEFIEMIINKYCNLVEYLWLRLKEKKEKQK